MAGAPFASISDFHRSNKRFMSHRNRKWQPTHVGYILAASIVYHPTKSLRAPKVGRRSTTGHIHSFERWKNNFVYCTSSSQVALIARPNLGVVTTLIYILEHEFIVGYVWSAPKGVRSSRVVSCVCVLFYVCSHYIGNWRGDRYILNFLMANLLIN